MPKKPKTDAELIDAFAHGIEERKHTSVAGQSANFVVFKIDGHSAWASVGSRAYVKTQHILLRKGQWWMTDKPKREWLGRVSPATIREALRRSEILKEPYSGNFQAPMCGECNVEMGYGEGYDDDGKLVGYFSCDGCGWSEDA